MTTPRRNLFDQDGRPLHVTWNYSRAELVADGIVHVLGIAFGVIGGAVLIGLAIRSSRAAELAAVAIYAACLVALKGVSAAYNLWPPSRTKWMLRRFDHACIFALIAATYTPFVTRMHGMAADLLLAGVWATAAIGVAAKIALPGRFDRVSIVLCLMLGGSGALVWETVSAALPTSTLWLMGCGAALYAGGVVFHVWEGLRFQNAVWHSCVLGASVLFYSAVLDGVVLA